MSEFDKATRESDDARFIRRIAEGLTPPELTPARRASIDANVSERVGSRPRMKLWVGAVASAAVAAGLALVVRNAAVDSDAPHEPAQTNVSLASDASAEAAWTQTLLWDSAVERSSDDRIDELPEEYRAITDVWLEG